MNAWAQISLCMYICGGCHQLFSINQWLKVSGEIQMGLTEVAAFGGNGGEGAGITPCG